MRNERWVTLLPCDGHKHNMTYGFWKRWIFAGIKMQWLGLQNHFVSTVQYLILLFMLCQCRNCRGIVCYFTATLHRVLSWTRHHRSVQNAWALLKLDRRINDLDLWPSLYLCCYWEMLCHFKLVMGHLSSVFSFVVYSVHHILDRISYCIYYNDAHLSPCYFSPQCECKCH